MGVPVVHVFQPRGIADLDAPRQAGERVGEGIGVAWPGDDLSILGLVVGFGLLGLIGVPLCRAASARAAKGAQA